MDAALGGGALADVGCYPVRLALELFGANGARAEACSALTNGPGCAARAPGAVAAPDRVVRGSGLTDATTEEPMKFAWLCSHESYQPEDLVKQAVAAEEAGFDAVLGSDHFHPWVDDTSAAGFVWSWLGAVAVQTSNVLLGTAVTCPLFHYHPALVAQMAATTDRLSGGRLMLGVGTGEALNERPLGFPFPGYGERQARMQEALEIMHRMFAGEKVTFHGEYYTTETAKLYSPPQGPRADPDGRGRPQVRRVRGHLRRRPHHQREGPGRHGRQGHRAVPQGRDRGGQGAPGPRHPLDRPRRRPGRRPGRR